MQFNSHADNQDLVSDVDFLLGTDATQYTLKNKARSMNERERMIWHMIFESYGGWQFIDDNISDASTGVPYGDQTITSGLGLYGLPSAALTVGEVSTLDGNSSRKQLKPMTHEEFVRMGGDARWTSNGVPEWYLLQGDILRLLPIPNFTKSADGIRVYFDQGIQIFVSTDTTATPGYASPFHRMLSIGCALDYAIANGMAKKAAALQLLWNDYEIRLRQFYSKRFKQRFPARIGPGVDLVDEYS